VDLGFEPAMFIPRDALSTRTEGRDRRFLVRDARSGKSL